MTNPTTPTSVVTVLRRPTPPSAHPRSNGTAAKHVSEISPRELLFTQEIVERMHLCKDPIALQPSDEDQIRKICQLIHQGSLFPWSLSSVLKDLVSYFSKAIEGSVELIEGSCYLVGKSFWQRILREKFDDKLITPEMWSFCTDSPERFEIRITLPFYYENDKFQLDRFKKLIIYFFAAQALPPLQNAYNHGIALGEFGRMINFVPITDAQQLEAMSEIELQSLARLSELKRVFDLIESRVKPTNGGTIPQDRFEALEIDYAQETSLKVVFGFAPRPTPDHFRLALLPGHEHNLSFELICPSTPWACLHQQLLRKSTPSQLIGRYWADLTLEGASVDRPDVTHSEIEAAFNAGLRCLPPGNEFRLAYYYNAQEESGGLPFLTLNNTDPLSPLGCVLFSHSPAQTLQVLRVIGNMQSCFEVSLSEAPRCRRVGSQLEIRCGQEQRFHLVIPFDSEKALSEVFAWLKQDADACLACLSHTILVLFPFFSDLPHLQAERRKDPRLIELYNMLRSQAQFSDAAIRFYFLLQGIGNVSDVSDLPNYIQYGAMTTQLDLMLKSLERIYQGSAHQPHFDAIYQRIASLQEKSPENCKQACIEQFLQCGEPLIVQQAWTIYQDEIRPSFLLEAGSRLDQHALPFALNRVCSLCLSLPPSEGFALLRVYHARIIKQGGPLCSNYQPILNASLMKVLQSDPTLWLTLFSDPIVKTLPSPEAPLLECLREFSGNLEPAFWWRYFLCVRRLLQEIGTFETFKQELSGVLIEALRHSDLRSQEGFSEVYQSLVPAAAARGISSPSQEIHYKVIEERDVLELPRIIAEAAKTEQLDLVLHHLKEVYQGSRFAPLLQAIRSKIAALKVKDFAACQQVCDEYLLLSEEPKIVAVVWTHSTSAQRLPFLLEIAPRLGSVALPFAVERVCKLARALPPSDAVRLLCVYHELPGAQDRTKIIGLLMPILEANRQLWLELSAYPSVCSALPTVEKSLLGSLRTSIKKSELSVWWLQFLGIQKVLQEKGTFEASRQELAKIFQAAHVQFNLSTQERFTEVYEPFAPEITDVSLRYAFFVQRKKCEESDVADLPDFVVYGVETNQLDSSLESIGRVYQGSKFAPLFEAVRKKVEVLEAKTVASCRQACYEQLLVCEEPKVLESVWAKSKSVQRLPFLAEVASVLNPLALPFALRRVEQYYGSLPAAEGVRLLCVYLDLLLRRNMTEEASLMKGLLDPLLKAHPAQRIRVLDYPSIPVDNESLLESLEAALDKPNLTVWWSQFLALRNTKDAALDRIFQKALRRFPDVRNQEGFVEVYNSIAQGLFERNDEAGLVALLKLLPVSPSAAVVLPWYQALIQQQTLSQETLTALIETGAYDRLDRTVLMNLINHLIAQKNFKAHSEVHTLCRAVSLQPTEIPALLEYFLAYYASGITDAVLIQDLKRSFSYFVSAGDVRLASIVHAACARLDKVQRNDPRWVSFAELLTMMEGSDIFLEEYVKVLESLAGNPPVQCFKLKFHKVSRLSAGLKFRLAKCYGVALGNLKSDKHKDEIVKALPRGWMGVHLQKDEAWEEFTRLFLHVHRGSIDFKDAKVLSDALWIAPHLLDHPTCSYFTEFETFLLRYPVSAIDTDEWRPYITRFVDRNPAMIKQADKAKKSFYEGCQTKAPVPVKEAAKQPAAVAAASKKKAAVECVPRRQTRELASGALESMLRAFASENIDIILDEPDQIRAKIKEMLSKMLVSIERLWDVLSLLESLPGEYELWASFFRAMPPQEFSWTENSLKLLRRGWIIWKNTHALEDFKPEFGIYWHNAVGSFLYRSTTTNDLWVSFMNQDAVGLLEKMEGAAYKNFSLLCLQMGSLYSWNEMIDDVPSIVRVLYEIADRCKDACSTLEPEYQARVALLLCNHPNRVIQEKGELLFTQNIQAYQTNSDTLQVYFTLYCVRPFIPRNPENLMFWIHNCWVAYKGTLGWDEICDLTKAVFQFPFKGENENARHRAQLLTSLRPILDLVPISITIESRKAYSLRYARSVFALDAFEDADDCQAASQALDDFVASLDDFQVATEEKQKCLIAFKNALPLLLNIQEPDLTAKIALAFNKIMRVLWVIKADLKEEFSWFSLLLALTSSIRKTNEAKRHDVARAVSQVYINCTHPDIVQKRNGPVPPEMLLSKSQTYLAFLFMVRTDPGFLTHDEWEALIHGIPLDSLEKMIEALNKSREESSVRYANSMAIARLIRYAAFSEPLAELCLRTAEAHLPPLVEDVEDLIQLDCRSHWLVALSALGKRCKELPVGFIEKKATLVSELTEFAIDGVVSEESYRTVLQTFKDIMEDDLEVAEAILISFNVAEDHPEEMLPKLEELEREIIKTVENLRERKK